MKFTVIKALLVGVTAIVLGGCGGSDGAANLGSINTSAVTSEVLPPKAMQSAVSSTAVIENTAVQKSSANILKGNADRTTIWPSNSIRVCYNLTEAEFASIEWHRNIIRAAVADTWEANSRVRFTGWEICPNSDEEWFVGIRIGFTDGNPNTPLGIYSYPWGMHLNLTYNFYFYERCANNVKTCLEFDAVHEFGHALGFSHEQNRDDTPDNCMEPKDDFFKGNDPIGAWDLYSIMNYCNPNYQKPGAATLSPVDVEMVQKYYGKPNETAYVAKYATGAIIGAFNVKTGVLRYPYVEGAAGLPNQTKPRLLHLMKSSADGQSVYIAVSDIQGGDEALRVIDTPSNAIVATKMVQDKIVDLQGSADGKLIYLLYKSLSGEEGMRAYDAQSLDIVADVRVSGAKLLARPRLSTGFAYVLAESAAYGQQTITEIDVAAARITQTFAAGAYGQHGQGIALSPNEKELFFITHAATGDNVPQLTGVEISSGKPLALRNLPVGTDVTEIELMDTYRILMGTNKKGTSPNIYNLGDSTTKPLIAPERSLPFSFPYVTSPDGKTIFSMYKQRLFGQSYFSLVRFDLEYGTGTYVDDDLAMIAFEVDSGVLDRPFAIAYPN